LQPKHILIVDDEPHVTCLLKKRLEKAGYSVATAFNGEDALVAIQEQAPDLILSDYQMPGCNGLDLAKRLFAEATTSQIPVLMLTARGHKIEDTEIKQTNIQQIVPKPFSGREIHELVEKTIGSAMDSHPPQDLPQAA